MIDWCELNSKATKKTYSQKLFLKAIKDAKDFFKPCPFNGVYKTMNMTLSKDVISIFPKGIYKSEIQLLDGNKTVFNTMKFVFLIFDVKNVTKQQ